jgi:DNA invertase Pin-like site-specific DNA recombinase
MRFGYARVSSNTQDHAAQVEALMAICEDVNEPGLGARENEE